MVHLRWRGLQHERVPLLLDPVRPAFQELVFLQYTLQLGVVFISLGLPCARLCFSRLQLLQRLLQLALRVRELCLNGVARDLKQMRNALTSVQLSLQDLALLFLFV